MTKYRLKKEYPEHKIGDIAIYLPDKSALNFLWEDLSNNYAQIEKAIIPMAFQPDQHSDWFELVSEKNYTIIENYFGSGNIFIAANKKGIEFKIGDKVRVIDIPAVILSFHPSEYDNENLIVVTTVGERDINAIKDYRFTTFDGYDIYRGELYNFIVHTFDDDYIIMKDRANCPDSGKHPEKYAYFLLNENALNYIEEKRNKRDNVSFITEDGIKIHAGEYYWYVLVKKNIIKQTTAKAHYSYVSKHMKRFFSKEAAEAYLQKERVIFTTEDGVELRLGDSFYMVNWNLEREPYEYVVSINSKFDSSYLYFSTREAADNYILLNKQVFSVEDVANIFNAHRDYDPNQDFRQANGYQWLISAAKQ